MTAHKDVDCPHGININFGCADCIRINRRRDAIPTVALMAVHLYTGPTTANDAATMAWNLYEAVVSKV